MQIEYDENGQSYSWLNYNVNALRTISNEVNSMLLCQSNNVMEVIGLVFATSDDGDTKLVGYLMHLCNCGSLSHTLWWVEGDPNLMRQHA